MVDGFEDTLVKALAADAAGALLPGGGPVRQQLTWSSTVPYTSGQTGIYTDLIPGDDVDAVILSDYAVSDEVGSEDSIIGIQVRVRAESKAKLKAIVSDVFDRWHGLSRCTLGGITVTACRRTSGTGIGQDRNGRLERTENYYFSVARPTVIRT